MSSVWRSRQSPSDQTLTVHGPVPAPIQKILSSRGLSDPQKIQEFLFPKLQSLKDPFLLKDLEQAVARLVEAFDKKQKVAIYCDFDLDGTSGLALMMTGLRGFGFQNLVPYQPARLGEGYGFHAEAVEALVAENVELIVTVDVGITALAAGKKAQELGVDVIITDHHLPGLELPLALAVINPNQAGDSSGLGYLSGAGVAFYLLRGLKRELSSRGNEEARTFDLKNVLEYFTIATLTDMVPLVEDNRVLVKHGLARLSQTDKQGLKALKEALNLDGRDLTSQDVAIRLAPKLNALSRMGSPILPIDVLLCDDQKVANALISKVLDNNQVRVQMQAEAEAELQSFMAEAKAFPYQLMVSPRFHRGLVGLLATKLSLESQKPSFVGALDESTGLVVGSARRPGGFDGCLVELLSSAKDHMNRFGGHSQAAGFEFPVENLEKIRACLDQVFKEKTFSAVVPELVYDAEIEFSEVSPQMMKWLDSLGPFGAQFEAPLFCFKNIKLQAVRDLRGGHLRLTCLHPDSHRGQEALLFSPTSQQREILTEGSGRYDILGELQWNYYNGQKTIQILVRDLRVSLWQ